MKKYIEYIGVPYKDMGREKDGLDCWGLVRLVMREQFFINLNSYSYNNDEPLELNELIDAEKGNDWVEVDKPAEGDIVLLRQLGAVSHVGIMVGKKTFIHASVGSGVIASEIKDTRWSNRLSGFYRHKGLCSVRVVTQESIFRSDTTELSFDTGTTVDDIVSNSPANEWRDYAHVSVQGNPIEPESWKDITVQRGALVTIVLTPKKDNIGLNVILSLAAMVLTGPGIFFKELLGVSMAIGQGIAGIVGMLLINAIVPVPRQDMLGDSSGTDVSNIYSITGPTNRINQYGAVPVILGQHKQVPPYAAKPYTSIVGDDLYFHGVFLVGYGPLSIQLPRLGDTSIYSYPEVEVEIQDGTIPNTPSDLFPSNVDEESLSITLNYDDGYSTRTTTADTDEISVDYVFPSGLCVINDDGSLSTRRITVNSQYRGVSSGTWLPFLGSYLNTPIIASVGSGYTPGTYDLVFTGGGGTGAAGTVTIGLSVFGTSEGETLRSINYTSIGNGYTSAPTITFPSATGGTGGSITATITEGYVFEGKSRQPFRKNFTKKMPTQDQFVYQTARTSAEADGDDSAQYVDTIGWTAFRSVSYDDVLNFDDPMGLIYVKMKATDSLNGQIQNLSVLAQSIGKQWNPIAEVWDDDQVLTNPGDLLRLWLQGPWRKKPSTDATIDLDGLADWNEFNLLSTNQFSFAYVLDVKRPLREVYDLICAAGRASRTKVNNKHSIIIDQARSLPTQIFTMKNSNNLRKARTFFTPPDCMRVKFIDAESDWQQQERLVYNDGFDDTNAVNFTSLTWPGVTDAAQIWKLARYQIGCSITRQSQVILDADFEHLLCGRGQLVHVANDVIVVGIATGRIQDYTTTTLTVREVCKMETGKNYSVEVRNSDTGTITSYPVVTVNGDNYLLTTDGDDFVCSADGDDIFAFGETGETSLPCLLQDKVNKDDLGATLSLVPYNEDVYTLGEGTVPSWNPVMSLPASLLTPDPPRVLEADEYLYSEEGSAVQGVSLRWVAPENTLISSYELQVYKPNGSGWEIVYVGQNPFFDLQNASPGLYSFRVRARRDVLSSTWLTLIDETIDSLATAAADVQNLRLIQRSGFATLVWDAVRDVRPVTYEVRYGGSDWDTSALVATTSDLSYQPSIRGEYYVKAKADAGYSINAESISISGESLPVNVVAEISETTEKWNGTFVDCSPAKPLIYDVDYFPSEATLPDAQGWTKVGTDTYVSVDADTQMIEFDNVGGSSIWYSFEAAAVDDVSLTTKFSFLNSGLSTDGFHVKLKLSLPDAPSNQDYQQVSLQLASGTSESFITPLGESPISLGSLETYSLTDVEVYMTRGKCWLYVNNELILDLDVSVFNTPLSVKTSFEWGKSVGFGSNPTEPIYFGDVEFQYGDPQGVMFTGSFSRTGGSYTTNSDNILDVGSDKTVIVLSPEIDSVVTSLTDDPANAEIIPELRARRDGRNREYSVREDVCPYDISVVKVNCGTTGYVSDFDIVYTEASLDDLTSVVSDNMDDLGFTWVVCKEVRDEIWTVAGEKSYTLDVIIPPNKTWGIRTYAENGTPTIYSVSGHTSSSLYRVDAKMVSSPQGTYWITTGDGGWTTNHEKWKAFTGTSGDYWEAGFAISTSIYLLLKWPSPRIADSVELSIETTLPGSEPEDYIIEVFENGSWVTIATVTGDTWATGTRTFTFTETVIDNVRITMTKTVGGLAPAIRLLDVKSGTDSIITVLMDADIYDLVTINCWYTTFTSSNTGVKLYDHSSTSYWEYPADTKDVTYWQAWAPVVAGEYLARWLVERIRGSFIDDNSRLSVYTWDHSIDMPDIDDGDTVAISSGGTAVTFAKVFQEAPALGHGIYNGATGDTVDITSLTATGFTAQIFDSSKVTKAGTLSYIVRGY